MKNPIASSKLHALAMASCLLLTASCVSTRKYNDVISQNARLQNNNHHLQAQLDQVSREKNDLEAANRVKQKSLNEKERSLQQEEDNLREMKALVEAQAAAIRNLKQEVCDALKCYTPDELTITVRDGKLYVSMSDKLLFESGSDHVNSRGKEAIAMLAAVLANSDLEIIVEGHTDNVPIHTNRCMDNWDLSVHRATSVTRILLENGIPARRIIPGGRGEYHPLANNESAEGRQLNRRTEIVLAPKLEKLWKLTEQVDLTSQATQ